MATRGSVFGVAQTVMDDLACLTLRLAFGGLMVVGHGWPKLQLLLDGKYVLGDPIGLGERLSMIAAVGAEFGCAIFIVVGLLTRLTSLPLIFNMIVAAFIYKAGERDFFATGQNPGAMEPAFIYLVGFVAILLLGPGRISLDYLLPFGKGKRDDD